MLWGSTYITPTIYTQLYQYAQLEVTTNFYADCSTLFTSKISLNLLVQKLLVEY